MKLQGLHDDQYWREQHKIFPHSLIPKAYVHAEKLTREEVIQAVKLTGSFDIAERWCKAQFPKLYDMV